jgi:hypothetical protein
MPPPWLTDIVKLLGFTTPLLYAAATYGFFLWLDKKASGPAKKAISGWLVPKEYDQGAVQSAILEMFDRVYTYPLFARRAFRRSAVITIAVISIVAYETRRFLPQDAHLFVYARYIVILLALCSNILSDYLSLFVVRWQLTSENITPLKALLRAPSIGVGVVLVVSIFTTFLGARSTRYFVVDIPSGPDEMFKSFHDVFLISLLASALINSSALLVHLWLPFFALCVGLLKGLNYFLLAANTAQWFLNRGKDHPLDAVGFVAAPLMFLLAAAVQMLR